MVEEVVSCSTDSHLGHLGLKGIPLEMNFHLHQGT